MLSGGEIRKLLKAPDGDYKKRLIITPILDENIQIKDGSGSIDLRLGSHFSIPIRSEIASLEFDQKEYARLRDKCIKNVHIKLGEELILHPRQFVLGHTLEWIHLPTDLGAYVIGRSIWGRHGLIIATAIGVHPGYSGVLTLELTNLGEVPIPLKPGLRYAQLFIHNVKVEEGAQIDQSTFMGSTKPSIGNIDFEEIDFINKLKEEI